MKDKQVNIYCHTVPYIRWAAVFFKDFCDDNKNVIVKTERKGGIMAAVLANGEEHYFMSDFSYNNWCKGRTYILENELYHSGLPVHLEKREAAE